MQEAYVGIDVAFAKNKRLPIVVCTRRADCLEPFRLRSIEEKPPRGEGNARILNEEAVSRFADATGAYLEGIEMEFGVRVRRIAIDAPSAPKVNGTPRRRCEIELDRRGIRCIGTPSAPEFEILRESVKTHLASGGAESDVPGANQLWMLIGFRLFQRLRQTWECLEVFPQAIVHALGANRVHKSDYGGRLAQLKAVAVHTHWPKPAELISLRDLGYGSSHDKLDAFLSAWVASLAKSEREPIGHRPDDVIWNPRL